MNKTQLNQFILMCEAAEEIQAAWKPMIGDRICSAECTLRNARSNRNVRIVQYTTGNIIHSREFSGMMDAKHRHGVVYLPLQHQLQDMLPPKLGKTFKHIYEFEFEKNEIIYPLSPGIMFTCTDQLYLAFVMKKLYNKIWEFKNKRWGK